MSVVMKPGAIDVARDALAGQLLGDGSWSARSARPCWRRSSPGRRCRRRRRRELMLMIRPVLDRIISRAAVRMATNALFRFVLMTASKSSSSMRRIRPSLVMPALFTSTSSRPCLSAICSIAAASALASAMSQASGSAEPPSALISSHDLLELVGVAGDGDDVQAVLGQALDDRRADAAGSAGDDCDAFFGHCQSSVVTCASLQ